MKYIIMCGGNYPGWSVPRQLIPINGEPVVERTIRLLREAGISTEDIAISSGLSLFKDFGVDVLYHENDFTGYSKTGGYWVDAFYPSSEPVCYLMGDVVFSPEAIRKIVNAQTDDVDFFASAPPFDCRYIKQWAEPFAFKVEDTDLFFMSIAITKRLQDEGRFRRIPIAWELWQVIRDTELNFIRYDNYTIINDYTCDIDRPEDAAKIERWAKALDIKEGSEECEECELF